ncbi:hypothetical protein CCACVL1_07070 [Corchorus capsularis]|uniref:RNase H type-1 domain-containing protein n=1 Tax=Corchorus capsularis TaxID=210143 RepID=A0A1R3J9T5_COCAP|nr:hypothetical protein CCACVL1_07070 [Corchorus capsularis]
MAELDFLSSLANKAPEWNTSPAPREDCPSATSFKADGNSSLGSFKDALLSSVPIQVGFSPLDFDVSDDEDDGDTTIPRIKLTREEKIKIRAPWMNSLIVNAQGRYPFKLFNDRIKALWSLKGKYQIIDLDKGHFLVRLERKEDYETALFKGPWFLNNSCLNVRKWRADFQPTDEPEEEFSAIWVRLPNLPFEYFNRLVIEKVVASLGKLIKVDFHTDNGNRGRFARMLVQIPLNKQLIDRFKIGESRIDVAAYRENSNFEAFVLGGTDVAGTSGSKDVGPGLVNVEDLNLVSVGEGPNQAQILESPRALSNQISIPTFSETEYSSLLPSQEALASKDDNTRPTGSSMANSSDDRDDREFAEHLLPVSDNGRLPKTPRGTIAQRCLHDLDCTAEVRADLQERELPLEPTLPQVVRDLANANPRGDNYVEQEEGNTASHGGVWSSRGELDELNRDFDDSGGQEDQNSLSRRPADRNKTTRKSSQGGPGGWVEVFGRLYLQKRLELLRAASRMGIQDPRWFPMKILSYNARGAANPLFKQLVRQLVADHKPTMLIITEPRISGSRGELVRNSLGFDGSEYVDPIGFSGGIWILWHTTEIDVTVKSKTRQEITVDIKAWDAHPFCFDTVVQKFIALVKNWNKNTFGNVFHNLKRIQARLLGIQKEISDNPSQFLLDLDRELNRELADILRKVESLWAMKFRVDWLLEGDNNTKFFHKTTIARRRSLYTSESDFCCLLPQNPPPGIRRVSDDAFSNLGDPISPYLFILCMEFLSLAIDQEVSQHNWNPILKVNANKTKIWFSPRVPDENKNRITSRLGFQKVSNLGVYLGHPTLVGKAKKNDFLFVIDKMRNKLSGWKAHNLSFAGKYTLIQSVSSTMADYSMNTSLLPAAIHYEMDRIHMNFLWGDTDEGKKVHLLSWNQVTKKKHRGGLSLRKSKFRNIALMAKLQWRAKISPEDLWVKALNGKYKAFSGGSGGGGGSVRNNSSDVWKGMSKGSIFVEKGLKKVINSGRNSSFWNDIWISNRIETLRSMITGPLTRNDSLLNVADCIEDDGTWNFSTTEFFHLGGSTPKLVIRRTVNVHWVPPCLGWLKLNSDGSSLGNPRPAGAGGYFRSENGGWILGYARRIDHLTSLQAELWGLRDGLRLAVDKSFTKLEEPDEVDSLPEAHTLFS